MYFDLNDRQIQILEFIKTEVKLKGYPPSIREICDHTNFKSTSSVHNHLVKLEKMGYLFRDPTLPRALTIKDNKRICSGDDVSNNSVISNIVNLPIISDFFCDKGLFDSNNISDYVPLPKSLVKGEHSFIYINKGNNMCKFGLSHKDYVVIDSKGIHGDGSLVLVLIHNEFTSIREYYCNDDSVTLRSDNDLILDRKLVKVIGVVTGVFRSI